MATNSRTLSAGAISEDTFYAAFEDVEPIQICSAKDACEMLEEIRNTISDSNNEWDKRNEALRKLRSLILSGVADYEGVDFFNELRNFEVPFQSTVKDLRSQVVREACITI
uniref:CLASP N-terminal domain-containing protein n=1 Tax=Romanomermis culicivorax TaxID=13658 RepID=A0A915I7I6_ROMCU